jgi:hypothetical protein
MVKTGNAIFLLEEREIFDSVVYRIVSTVVVTNTKAATKK